MSGVVRAAAEGKRVMLPAPGKAPKRLTQRELLYPGIQAMLDEHPHVARMVEREGAAAAYAELRRLLA